MIIRTLAYLCDKCKKVVATVKAHDILNVPEGWVLEPPTFGYDKEFEKHICPRCVEKKEIKETFK